MAEEYANLNVEQHGEFICSLAKLIEDYFPVKMSRDEIVNLWEVFFALDWIHTSVLFLEKGNPTAGLQHILAKHGKEFASHDIRDPRDAIERALRVTQDRSEKRSKELLAALIHDDGGKYVMVAVIVGTNGFIVSAYPVSRKKFRTWLEQWGLTIPAQQIHPGYDSSLSRSASSSKAKESQRARWDPSLTRASTPAPLPREDEVHKSCWLISIGMPSLMVSEPGDVIFLATGGDAHTDELDCDLVNALCTYEDACLPLVLAENSGAEHNFTASGLRLERARLSLQAFILAYKLRETTGHRVYVDYLEQMIEVRGASVRLASKVILADLAEQFEEEEVEEVAKGLHDIELSSSHHGSSSPTKSLRDSSWQVS